MVKIALLMKTLMTFSRVEKVIGKSRYLLCGMLLGLFNSSFSYAYQLSNDVFSVETGKYGNIDAINIQGTALPPIM